MCYDKQSFIFIYERYVDLVCVYEYCLIRVCFNVRDRDQVRVRVRDQI